MSEAIPKTIGPYEVLRTVGKGGMGEVLLAYDPRLDRQVAIKRIRAEVELDETRRQRFRREAQVAAHLNHPAIVQVFDLLTEGDLEHIVMEYVPGKSLRSIVKQGALPVSQGLAMALRLADGVTYAHRRGVVHRDLKSENVLVTSQGEPKITDFGIARRLLTEGAQETLTRDGMVLGTYRAMSPEQIRGEKVDGRSDLFSFGVLLYEIFTGQSPFQAESETATLARVLNEEPEPVQERVAEVPPELSALIAQLLQKDPHLRPRNAEEVAQRLRRIEGDPENAVAEPTGRMTVVEGRPVAPSGSDRSASVTTPSSATRRRSGERRQVTVLGCDLVGLSDGSQTLDPERLYTVMPEFRECARRVVERYEGQIESLAGHRLVAYFGYPRAHEDDAWRAVRTALELVRQIEDLQGQQEEGSGRVAARAAVHTGLAVILPDTQVGETRTSTTPSAATGERGEQVILGQTLDLTGGLQTLAEAGSVVISSATRRLVGGFFATEELPATRVAGSDRPVTAYRITAEREVHSRLEAGRELSPLVARERELGLLQDRWEMARQGAGQVVLISGEAGIGKSRLVRSLREALAAESPTWLFAQGSPHTRNTPLQPMANLVRQLAGLRGVDSSREQVDRLEGLLRRHDFPLPQTVPLLAPLLSLPLEGRYPALDLPPPRQRARTMELLPELILQVAERRPIILAIEDLHWVDPSTLELLGVLIEQGSSVSLFLVLTFRPEFEVSWSQSGSLTQLSLTRLARQETSSLIRQLAGDKPLPAEVERQILAKTDGVPLFVEELTRTILESELMEETAEGWTLTTSLGSLDIPATLRESLTARLDRLEEEVREVTQYASILGRSFDFPLLAAIVPLEEATVRLALDRLVQAGLLERRGLSWVEARYRFRHALIQDAANEALLEGHRRTIHRRVAEVLQESFSQIVAREPELLAHHCEEAELLEPGVEAWRRAGDRAAERCAYVEAGHHYQHALDLLERLPSSPDRSVQELELRSALGRCLISTKGYGEEEVKENFTRAWELCEGLGDIPLPVRYGIWAVHLMRGDREGTDEMARWFEGFLETTENPTARLMVYNCLGIRAFYLGRYAEAEELVAKAMELFEPEEHREVAGTYGGCGGFYCYLVTTWILVMTGRLDQAVEHQRRALELAEEMGEPYTLTMTWVFEMMTAHQRRQTEQTGARAEKVIELARQHGFPWLEINGECGRGWVQAHEGDPDAGIARMRKALTKGWHAAGIRLLFSFYSGFLIEILLKEGRVADGLGAVEEALGVLRTSLDLFYEPELLRLQAELLRRAGSPAAKVESTLRDALGTARDQGAKLLELRLATSLARLLADEDRHEEAVELLAPVVEGFTEGRDTSNYTEATALLAELG